jgi:hypothetical protein
MEGTKLNLSIFCFPFVQKEKDYKQGICYLFIVATAVKVYVKRYKMKILS